MLPSCICSSRTTSVEPADLHWKFGSDLELVFLLFLRYTKEAKKFRFSPAPALIAVRQRLTGFGHPRVAIALECTRSCIAPEYCVQSKYFEWTLPVT